MSFITTIGSELSHTGASCNSKMKKRLDPVFFRPDSVIISMTKENMMNISDEFLKNQVFQNELISFDDRLPYQGGVIDEPAVITVPKAARVLADGTVKLTFYAPNASSVTATNYEKTVSL